MKHFGYTLLKAFFNNVHFNTLDLGVNDYNRI